VTYTGTVAGDERIRLFLALRLPDPILDAIEAWQVGLRGGGRIVTRANLHVTLAFLGHRPQNELEPIVGELRAAGAAAAPIVFQPRGYRETRSVAMLTLDDADAHAGALARDLHERLERLGVYRPETREWLPHVTVLRFRQRPRLDPGRPPLGAFAPSGAAAYLSRLSPTGARYEVLENVALGR
jgi:RNA 2',3'-cyclic 3'-phosphodiesterase